MNRRRNYNRPTLYLLTIIFVAISTFVFIKLSNLATTQAVDNSSSAEFDAGNIITNEVMGNYNSMTEAEIQSFLDSKNSCGQLSFKNGQMDGEFYVETVGSKTYKWHLDSNQKHICLAEEKFSDNGVIGSGDTAAHLIYTYAQEYQINPQVILVLLQKEQGLLTDPYPNNYDYGWALGFGAYDYGAWNTKYAGFKEQLKAAFNFYHWFIYEYDEADSWWDTTYTESSPTFIKLGESNVAYNKNSACGYSTINIQNTATVSLYVYTPYQPNSTVTSGAKDATCGAYGNWNFYNFFTSYFDSTQSIFRVIEPDTLLFSNGDFSNEEIYTNFKDMPSDEISKTAVSWAANNGITDKNEYFNGEQPLTRRQAMVLLWRVSGQPETTIYTNFKDMPSDEISKTAVSWAANNGITDKNEYFNGEQPLTRRQAMVLLYRIYLIIQDNLL